MASSHRNQVKVKARMIIVVMNRTHTGSKLVRIYSSPCQSRPFPFPSCTPSFYNAFLHIDNETTKHLTCRPLPRYPSTWPTCQNSNLFVHSVRRVRRTDTITPMWFSTDFWPPPPPGDQYKSGEKVDQYVGGYAFYKHSKLLKTGQKRLFSALEIHRYNPPWCTHFDV